MVVWAMPFARNASRSLDGNTIRSSPVRTVSGWKVRRASRTVSDRWGKPNRSLAIAKVLEHEPFIGCGLRGALLGGHLGCDVGERQRSPPEGRRRKNGFHVFRALFKAKKSCSPKRRRLLTAMCGSPTFSGVQAEIWFGGASGAVIPFRERFFLRVTPVVIDRVRRRSTAPIG